MMGAERRTMVMTEDEKILTAYHGGRPRHRRAQRAGDRPGLHKATIIRAAARSAWSCSCPSANKLSMTMSR